MRQMAMAAALIAGLAPLGAQAEDWRALTGPEITRALTARTVVYAGGQVQDFHANGTTTYDKETGRWRVQGDMYCSTWPPRESWTCYRVEVAGIKLRFIGEVGNISEGRYIDL